MSDSAINVTKTAAERKKESRERKKKGLVSEKTKIALLSDEEKLERKREQARKRKEQQRIRGGNKAELPGSSTSRVQKFRLDDVKGKKANKNKA